MKPICVRGIAAYIVESSRVKKTLHLWLGFSYLFISHFKMHLCNAEMVCFPFLHFAQTWKKHFKYFLLRPKKYYIKVEEVATWKTKAFSMKWRILALHKLAILNFFLKLISGFNSLFLWWILIKKLW